MKRRVLPQQQERPTRGADRDTPLLLTHARESRDQVMLDASRAVVELFLQRRTSAFPVKELAAHAGLAERTFYRYFPRKEDAIRPYIDAGLRRLIADVRAFPRSRSLGEALVSAHTRAFREGGATDWGVFLSVLNETESLRAVWLQVVTDAEAAFADVIAEWLGIHPASLQARLAGAVIVTAGRFALEQSSSPGGRRHPGSVFAECLALLGPTLFEKPAAKRRPVRRPSPLASVRRRR